MGFLENRISPVDAFIVMADREEITSAKELEEMRMKTRGNRSE